MYSKAELVTMALITADVYDVAGDEFAVEANLTEVLVQYGRGVYPVRVWATVGGGPVVISAVSVFQEVELPEGYD